jgi:hypothetical protein
MVGRSVRLSWLRDHSGTHDQIFIAVKTVAILSWGVLPFERTGLSYMSRDSPLGIALGYGLDDGDSMVRFLAGAENFSVHHRVQNGSGVHPASYPMGNRGSFPGGKEPGRETDHSPPSSAEVKEWVELYLHSPMHLHDRGAQLKHRDNFTLLSSLAKRVKWNRGVSYPVGIRVSFPGGEAAEAWSWPFTSI